MSLYQVNWSRLKTARIFIIFFKNRHFRLIIFCKMTKIVQKLCSILVKKLKQQIVHSKKTRKTRATIVLDYHLPIFYSILAATATRRSCRTKKPNKYLLYHRELLGEYYNGQKSQKTMRKVIQVTKTVHFSPKIEYFYFKSEKIARYELRKTIRIRV